MAKIEKKKNFPGLGTSRGPILISSELRTAFAYVSRFYNFLGWFFKILGSFFEFFTKNQVFADPPRFSPILVFWGFWEFLRASGGFVWFDTSKMAILGKWKRVWVISFDFGLIFPLFHQKSGYFEVLLAILWYLWIWRYFPFSGTSCETIELILVLKNPENYSTLFIFWIFRYFDVLRSKNEILRRKIEIAFSLWDFRRFSEFSPILVFWGFWEFLNVRSRYVWFETFKMVILGIWKGFWMIF